MKGHHQILKVAKETILLEAKAIEKIADLLDGDFEIVVNRILESRGRVIVTGIGKSAIIATKIVATFNSTGTPAVFMHAADAIHGDLGTIQKEDVVICISKSGNTPEIKVLVPLIKDGGNILVAITGDINSFLAQRADFVLNTHVDKEACPNNLAPTTSTTAQLVMGDALAVALLNERGFGKEDFARFHPGGSLGKKLYLRVGDITAMNQKPWVKPDTSIKEVIVEISEKMLGVTAVIDGDKLVGIITDGDIRRMLAIHSEIGGLRATDIMTKNPKSIPSDMLAIDALEILEQNAISQLLVVDKGMYNGVVHLHNLMREGIL